MGLTVNLKRSVVAGAGFNRPALCILEDTKIENQANTALQTHTITCGLTNTMLVAPRYVIDNGVLVSLRGCECMCKHQYEKARGLSRAASTYYNLADCAVLARVSITFDKSAGNRPVKYYVTLYSMSKIASATAKSISCNRVQLDPQNTSRVASIIIDSILRRGIIEIK